METRTVTHQKPMRTTRNESIPRWSRRARLFLGIMTFVLIGVFAFAAVSAMLLPLETAAPLAEQPFGPLHFLLVLATFMQFLLMLFYLSFAAQNPRLSSRGLWMVAIVFLPWAILPVYWFQHIWSAPYVADPESDYNVPGGEMTPHAD